MASAARIPELQDEAPASLIPAIAETGRYQISVDLCATAGVISASTRCDDLDLARRTLDTFTRAHRTDSNALGGIYDFRTFAYVETWRGGQAFGPVDPRHPVERLFARAIASGQRTSIITPGFSRTFNDGAAS